MTLANAITQAATNLGRDGHGKDGLPGYIAAYLEYLHARHPRMFHELMAKAKRKKPMSELITGRASSAQQRAPASKAPPLLHGKSQWPGNAFRVRLRQWTFAARQITSPLPISIWRRGGVEPRKGPAANDECNARPDHERLPTKVGSQHIPKAQASQQRGPQPMKPVPPQPKAKRAGWVE